MNDNNTKTKKIIKPKCKQDLWKQYDYEINSNKEPLECVYRQNGQRDFCECCNNILIITDEGFLVCQNPSCGVMYKDMLDQTVNGDFMVDDNSSADPTRCGLPINPLLVFIWVQVIHQNQA